MKFNEQQKNAIEFYGRPQIILAGAGTGKTTVMIEKINYIIRSGFHQPHQILALTFTNKAANEMKTRFQNEAHQSTPFLEHFIPFAYDFLRPLMPLKKTGLTKQFTILDSQSQKEIIQKYLNHSGKNINLKPKDLLSQISSIKQYPHSYHAQLLSTTSTEFQELFKFYNNQLIKINSVDFDDLILHTFLILNTTPDILHAIQTTYQYIMVDEYQDTNKIQNDLCILLARQHENICVVGDFDQTIYSWRGAKIENLLEFNQVFPSTETQKLEINYRSTKEILNAANTLIKFNTNRQEKKLISHRESNNKIKKIFCYNEKEEAEFIIQEIKRLKNKNQYNLSDFAILYRTNQQSRAIEEALTHHNIAHKIVGTTPFYQRAEIKAAISYLHCIQNINQPIWFEKAILTPARGVGKTSISRLINFSLDNNLTIEDSLCHPECPLKPRYLEIIQDFITFINEIKEKNTSIKDKLADILTYVHFDEHLAKQENSNDRKNNIDELLSRCNNIDSLETFLNDIVLFQDSEIKNEDVVSCLTLHLAKGLEFPIVFIPGFEEELLPFEK